ncbi:hypothetical protein D5086_020224 [Populus alba]|uniref:Uncharacterized protein n=1 Tax=Populus alba TaxID=43335 RepID=A0ACC4BJG1_POPAL
MECIHFLFIAACKTAEEVLGSLSRVEQGGTGVWNSCFRSIVVHLYWCFPEHYQLFSSLDRQMKIGDDEGSGGDDIGSGEGGAQYMATR